MKKLKKEKSYKPQAPSKKELDKGVMKDYIGSWSSCPRPGWDTVQEERSDRYGSGRYLGHLSPDPLWTQQVDEVMDLGSSLQQ